MRHMLDSQLRKIETKKERERDSGIPPAPSSAWLRRRNRYDDSKSERKSDRWRERLKGDWNGEVKGLARGVLGGWSGGVRGEESSGGEGGEVR